MTSALPLWVLPAIPLAGFVINALLGTRLGKSFVSTVGVGAAGLVTLAAYSRLIPFFSGTHATVVEPVTNWITVAGLSIDVSFRLDPLSALMLAFVTFVAFLIHVYAIGYMHGDHATDAGYARFFAYLNLFLFAMLTLVLAESFLLMFVGWEGVGLCSYLLVGYYFDREYAAAAGRKAFVVNRIGDYGFLLGMFGIFAAFGSLNYSEVFRKAAEQPAQFSPALSVICLCLFIGAMGKSAQVPLYVWLPDAMAGPTPVSALIHAATMVTAGVYMLARCNVLFRLAPEVMLFVAVIGCFTALFAGTIAIAQQDLKKVLAYSTISQLGYMFLACGVGAFGVGMFHVMTHACFKACLFLGAGSVMHAMSDDLDLRHMGGLRAKMPITFWTFMAATLAISGIPPFAGFFSKDAILASSFEAPGLGKLLWFVGLATAGLTAFYMFRIVSLTFYGEFRGTKEQAHHVHEAPASMTFPLIVLGLLSLVAGWLGLPAVFGEHADVIGPFLAPVFAPITGHAAAGEAMPHATEWLLMAVSVAVAASGLYLAYVWYAKQGGRTPARLAASYPAVYGLVADKYRIDELYDVLFVRPFAWLARTLWKVVDVLIIDGFLNAAAFLVELAGDFLRFLQTGNVRNYALTFFLGLVALLLFVVGAI
ncbi:MAG TPA: NADH-quinone oxidoreductase subunit L [Thermoanaerobaculia bacterium]|jgi:NADH-quinone oxidoreductase subunit L|nr:NADH-quinone oxidoreductase subunit L [Thermoanaerobaculia bacterium]